MTALRAKITIQLQVLVVSATITLFVIRGSADLIGNFYNLQYDDSYITFRYAQNLVLGNGFRFNPGDNSNSASSPIFGAIIAAGLAIGTLSAQSIANIVNVLSLFSMCYFLIFLGTKLTKGLPGILIGAMVALAVTAQGYITYWTFSGMESTTHLALMSLAVGYPLAVGKSFSAWSTKQRYAYSVILFFFSIFRPESFIISLLIVFLLFSSEPLKNLRTKGNKIVLVSPLIAAATLALFWNIYYKHPVPDPIRYKRIATAYDIDLETAVMGIKAFATNHSILVIVFCFSFAVVTFNFIKSESKRLISWTLVPSAALFAFSIYLGQAPNSDSYRYQLPYIPIVGLAFLAAAKILFDSKWLRRKSKRCSMVIITGLSILLLVPAGVQGASNRSTAILGNYWWWYLQQARIDAGSWMEENTPKNSRVLSGDLGAVAFYNPSNFYIDSGGLANSSLLDSVERGYSYSDKIIDQNPSFMVDTQSMETIGSERIFNETSSFYNSGTYSNCKFSDVYKKTLLKRFPELDDESGLFIGIYHLEKISDCR